MEIKQLKSKEKIITFFGEVKSCSVESAIKDIAKINLEDLEYVSQCEKWAIENNMPPMPVVLNPISLYLSTSGGSCYDGLALYDTIAASNTPIEIYCSGKIMSIGIIVILAAEVRKAYRNTTFMIHQVGGVSFGKLRDLEDSVEEAHRINEMLFKIIKNKTKITEQQLEDVLNYKKDWFITAEEALELGIITEIL